MYRINKKIIILKENRLEMKEIFLSLYKCVGKTVYVENNEEKIIGIITPADFLCYYVKKNSKVKYNESFRFIEFNECEEIMLEEAQKIFQIYGIRGAIPIKNQDGTITGEILEDSKLNIEECIAKHKEIFLDFEHSLYLKKEVVALRQLICAQEILVIGGQEEFEKKIGFVFSNCSKVRFIDDGEDYYELLVNCGCLLVDVTDEYPLRYELYQRLGVGYMWNDFLTFLEEEVRKKILNRYTFLVGISKNHEFVKDVKNHIIDVRYDCGKTVVFTIVLNVFNLADVKICKIKTLKKENKNAVRYIMRGEIRELGGLLMEHILYDYLYELQLKQINNSYKNTILNYYMGRNIHLFEEEKKSAESSEYFEKYVKQKWVGKGPSVRDEIEGDVLCFSDYINHEIHYENGIRKTLYHPDYYAGTIWCIGLCTMFGAFVNDESTIPSTIQRELLKSGYLYRVVNLGFGAEFDSITRKQRVNIQKNDIIVILHIYYENSYSRDDCYIDISSRMEKLHNQIFFGDTYAHVNAAGSEAYAKAMLPEIMDAINSKEKTICRKNNPFEIYKKVPFEYKMQKKMDKIFKEMDEGSSEWKLAGKIGAIVMNANPFTNGHLYLIKQALLYVDYLYVFVVEEDKSYFGFTDRFNMVVKGTEEYRERVAVVPSGILVTATFMPDYFNSNKNVSEKEISVVTNHINFARYIASYGNITYQFVGTEENDHTTAQYNRDLKYVLPYYDITLIEIPRLVDKHGRECRAGILRDGIEQGKIDEVRWIIPDSTYKYLTEHGLDGSIHK